MSAISPQGNATTTAERNALYSGISTAISPAELNAHYPLYADSLVLTGLDGISKPISQHFEGRVLDGTLDRTIEGASTITVTMADPDRGVLTSPVLSTGLPSISAVATELLNDVHTLGIINPQGLASKLPGGSVRNQQVPGSASQGDEAARNKQLVVQIGVNRGIPREGVVIAMMTMLDESGGINDTSPDSNGSSGIFQQTPSQGWGTRTQVNDPVYATNKFYDALLGVHGWQNLAPWVAAQSVQRSAWTGHPNSNNNYSSELGGNYHLMYDQALQEVQAYRPQSLAVTTTNNSTATGTRAKLVLNKGNKLETTVGFQAHAATASLTYKGRQFSLVRIQTQGSRTILTFEDAMINQLRRNKNPYTSAGPTSIPLFINQLLAQDGFAFHFVQQGVVVSRVDPTGALDAGQSDPATLANFDQLLATDGQRGTGTLRQLTKFASVVSKSAADPVLGNAPLQSSNGVVEDTWSVITGLIAPLRWIAMSDGQDFYIGSEQYVSHYINKPPILVDEDTEGIGWLEGEFDLGTETSNTLTFTVDNLFVGVPAQKVIIQNKGLLSGIWMIHDISTSLFTTITTVTCQRIQADLEDPEHQAATDKLLTTGGGITTTNSGVANGSRPSVTGQKSQNGWPSGDTNRADIQDYSVAGTSVRLSLNRVCAPLLTYVAEVFNARVQPLDASQCGGYAYRKDVNNLAVWSNHSSGTAIDLNSAKHPNGSAPLATFTQAQIDTIHQIVQGLGGAVRWGGDYRGTPDSMHFEVNTDYDGVKAALNLIGYRDTTGGPGQRGGN